MSATVAASCTINPALEASATVTARFVIDETIGTWSSSCNDPEPHRPCGARPPSTTSGEPLNQAVVMAETPFVIPGPAVSTARPGVRVSLAYPSAAKVAVCSCRVSTIRTSLCRAAS